MFTGIIEELGTIQNLVPEDDNLHIHVQSNITNELKIDQSVAHNGVCLTVVEKEGDTYVVTAIKETLDKSNLGKLAIGQKVNLERCMQMNGRLDGHIVQGHVDTTATMTKVEEENGSWKFTFEYKAHPEHVTVEKGSITINGVSLTVVESTQNGFSVAIIPYTYEHTQFHTLQAGDRVNLEFDIIDKYVANMLANR